MSGAVERVRLAVAGTLARCCEPFPFPGKYRVLSRIAPTHGRVRTCVHGAWLELDVSELNQRYIWLRSHYRREWRMMRHWLRAGQTMFDVGANAGYFTLAAARRTGPHGCVVAFEPNPDVRARLQQTVTANHLEQVQVAPVALSDRQTTAELRGADPDDCNATATLTGTPDMPLVATVETTTLDAWCAQNGFDRIDYLKIDVDGAEQQVLRGARELIRDGRIGVLQIEFCDYWLRRNDSTPQQFDAWLQQLGFRRLPGQPPFRDGEIVDRFYRLETR